MVIARPYGMREWIRQLAAQQVTVPEQIVFLLVAVAVMVALAWAAYTALVSVLWALGFRRTARLPDMYLLPPIGQWRRRAGEYLLVFFIGAFFAFVIGARNDVVSRILEHKVVVDTHVADTETRLKSATEASALAVVKPLVSTGVSAPAQILVQDIILDEPTSHAKRIEAFVSRGAYVVAAVLTAAYLAWLVRYVARQRRVSGEDPPPAPQEDDTFQTALKKLSMLAVSVALLLLPAAAFGKTLPDSCLSAATLRAVPPDEKEVAEAVNRAARNIEARVAPRVVGLKGDKGGPGTKGDSGAVGMSGAKGETGPVGAKGDQGLKGDPGPQGPRGEPGPAGPQGPPGRDGSIEVIRRVVGEELRKAQPQPK